MKEDIIPAAADAFLFRMAPYLVVMGFVGAFVCIPFSGDLIVADLNIGILYISAVTSLVVLGILMAGWASNNKWSLFGGIRSAAQIVSYEIPSALSIFVIILITGTLSMQEIIRAQGWAPHQWFISTTRLPSSLSSFSSLRFWRRQTARPLTFPRATRSWWPVS